MNNIRDSSVKGFAIGTEWECKYCRGGLDKKYIQMADIDLSSYATGEGWVPIGSGSVPFVGIYDGNSYNINNLTVNRPNADYQGLFGYMSNDSKILNVNLKNISVKGKSYIGSLVGFNNGGSIINSSYLTGSIKGSNIVGGDFLPIMDM